MKESIFSKKRILLLGSGELGKELVIESKRLGLEVIAIDRYEKAPVSYTHLTLPTICSV